MKKFVKKYKSQLIITLVITLIYLLYLIISKIHPFGENTLFISDIKGQYFEYWIYMKNAIFGKESFIYSFSKSIGGNVFGIWSYYLLSPYNILFLIVKTEYYIDVLTIITYLKILSASLTFYAFSKYKTDNNKIKIIFSIAYSLMGYVVSYQMNIMWLDAIILLPVIAVGVLKIIQENKFNTYIIGLSIALITNFYIGFQIFLFICMYFIYELILSEKTNKIRTISRFVIYTTISIGIASIIIVPTYFVLKSGKGTGILLNRAEIFKTNFRIINFIPKFLIGSETKEQIYGNGMPIAYCGILTLVFIEIFLINKNIKLKEKVATISFIVVLIFIMNNRLLNLIFHGLKETTGYPYRYAFCLSFIMITTSLKLGNNIREIRLKELFITIILNIIIGIFLVKYNYDFIQLKYIIISFILLIIYPLILIIDKKTITIPIIGIILCIELLINYTFTFKELKNEAASRTNYINGYKEFKEMIENISENDKEFYRIEKKSNFYLNDALMLNYKGISHSSSTFDKNVSETLKKIGYSYYMDWPSYSSGNTILTDMIFNIKYKISKNEDEEYFEKEKTFEKYHILKNKKYLPIGFISDGYIKQLEKQPKSPFEYQNKILNDLTNLNENYFNNIQIDEIKYNNINEISKNEYKRRDETSNIELKINENNSKNIYFYISTNYNLDQSAFKIHVNDEIYDEYAGATKNGILNINNKNKINNIKIYFNTDKQININEIKIKTINEQKFEKAYNKIEQRVKNINYKNEKMTIDVEPSKDGYLNIMLPNEYSWQIKIDSKEIKQLSDAEFISIKINSGNHKIEMKYKLKGRKIAISLFIMSIIALIILNIYSIKKIHLKTNKLLK